MTRSSPDNAALCQSVARKVLSSMRRARQPDTYGSSYANSMNEDISREVAEDIVASFQPAHSSAGRASAAEVEVHVHDLIAEVRKATIEECAKIAENNGWEATAAQIRGLALPSTEGKTDV